MSTAERKGSLTGLSPTLKERRRQTLKYFAQNDDLDKEEIMDFFQNEIRRKTSMDMMDDNNIGDMIDSDCKDDFDSDDNDKDNDKDKDNDNDNDKDENPENTLNEENKNENKNVNENDIKNGELPTWSELLMDDSTRQQFEELAREYVGNIAEEKKKLQNEHYLIQQKYLKLQESHKSLEENLENIQNELINKDELINKLSTEITTLSVNKQDLLTKIAKSTLNLQHHNDTITNLNATISEYKNQNQILSQNLNELTIKMEDESNDNNDNDDDNNDDIMDNIEFAFKTNKKQIIVDIINSFKSNSLKSNDEIGALIEDKTELKNQINDFEKEQQTLSLNNEALKNLVETHQSRLKNIQKQHQNIKNKFNDKKQLNEQLQIDINAKNEFIQQLKQQNDKLEISNQELMIINSDLRHELEIYDQTILNNKNSPKINKNNKNKKSMMIEQILDRKSFDEEDEDDIDDYIDMPSLLLSASRDKQRRSSVPTSIYEQNLDIIVKSVNNDEYKFMEDLSKEKKTLEATPIRSDILKRCHSDAEKEFFFMMVLCCKLELSTTLGITNHSVSDLSPQNIWNKAQKNNITLHQFHDYIKNELFEVITKNKHKNEQIKHHWSSYNSMIADKLRQNDLTKYKQNNPHLKIIDPEIMGKKIKTKTKQKKQKQQETIKNGRGRQRAYTVSVGVPYSEKQTLIDEDEDDIYAAMNKNGNKKIKIQRRDSQNLKKTIIQSFNELQQQQQEQEQEQEQQENDNNNKLNDIQNKTEQQPMNVKAADTYDLL